MTAYTIMKVDQYEDDMIPKLALYAFRHAFDKACSVATVVYAKDAQLLQRQINGQEKVLKDLSTAYISAAGLPSVLKRQRKHQTAV